VLVVNHCDDECFDVEIIESVEELKALLRTKLVLAFEDRVRALYSNRKSENRRN